MRGGRKIARRSRRRSGGEPVKLTNILITQPIIEAVKQQIPDFDYKMEGFKLLTAELGDPGFKLSRMDRSHRKRHAYYYHKTRNQNHESGVESTVSTRAVYCTAFARPLAVQYIESPVRSQSHHFKRRQSWRDDEDI